MGTRQDPERPSAEQILFPISKNSPNGEYLPQMIRVVVGDQQSFSQNCLPRAVRNFRKEVRFGTGDQLFHRLEVSSEHLETFFPRLRIRRRLCRRPVARGPVRRGMLGIARKLQDVPLRDAHVLEQFPERIRQPVGTHACQSRRHTLERRFPVNMSAAPGKKIHEMLAQEFFLHCISTFFRSCFQFPARLPSPSRTNCCAVHRTGKMDVSQI